MLSPDSSRPVFHGQVTLKDGNCQTDSLESMYDLISCRNKLEY